VTLGTNDYPLGASGCSTAADWWGCEIRQCTSFCAWRATHDFGLRNFRCPGNARVWGSWFAARGYRVDSTPAYGAIACLQPGDNGTFDAGHVAVVLGVMPGGVVRTESYNWCDECCAYSQQTLQPVGSRRYIHLGTPVGTATVGGAAPLPIRPVRAPSGGSGDLLLAAVILGAVGLGGYAAYREHPQWFHEHPGGSTFG